VKDFIQKCDVCQRNKSDLAVYPGLLHPLSIPDVVWSQISMDFIDGLPKSYGYEVILVVVDRLSKYGHFLPLKHPYTAQSVAKVFLDTVVRLHGLPDAITSDRDAVFLSSFWQELFTLQGVLLHTSSAYHPQSDGQTEVLNRCLETYLRCYCNEDASNWFSCLPMAEYWYNTCHHSAIQTTPYEALYGRPPPLHLPYLPGESASAEVDGTLVNRKFKLQLLKHHLRRAQLRMKQQADSHRSDRHFEVGDWVYFKVQPYKQATIAGHSFHKLAAKYYGPFQILKRVGPVAYTLLLPSSVKIHSTVHVSLLKKCYEIPAQISYPPVVDLANPHCPNPELVLQRRMVKKGNKAVAQLLVKWHGLPADAATWEFATTLKTRFPLFDP